MDVNARLMQALIKIPSGPMSADKAALYSTYTLMAAAFPWRDSEQGYDYWAEVACNLIEMINPPQKDN